MRYSEMDLQQFFPDCLRVTDVEQENNTVQIRLKSCSKSYICPKCKSILTKRRATYNRKVQDLPIFGHPVRLIVNVYEYECPHCDKAATESFPNFLSTGSRMTERCLDFIVSLALETSCEGASRILKELGIQFSGDSIIRLLLKRLEQRDAPDICDVVGVDDFSFKKRSRYGTILVDGYTHKTIAVLDGRDEATLKEWLRSNKHIKVVTRDRASAYSKAIQEMLPDAMQIADRFHLHQNLLDAIKRALNAEIPNTITVDTTSPDDDAKKRGHSIKG